MMDVVRDSDMKQIQGSGGNTRIAIFAANDTPQIQRPPVLIDDPAAPLPTDAAYVVEGVGTLGQALNAVLASEGHLRRLDLSCAPKEKDARLLDLGGLDLTRVDMRRSNLTRRDLTDVSSMRGVDLRGSCLDGVNMSGADATGGRFDDVRCVSGTFAQARFVGSSWSGAAISTSDMKNSTWEAGADLDHQDVIRDLGISARVVAHGDPLAGASLAMNDWKGAKLGQSGATALADQKGYARVKVMVPTAVGLWGGVATALEATSQAGDLLGQAKVMAAPMMQAFDGVSKLALTGMDWAAANGGVEAGAAGALAMVAGTFVVIPQVKKWAEDKLKSRATPLIERQIFGSDAVSRLAIQDWARDAAHNVALVTRDLPMAIRLKRSFDAVRQDTRGGGAFPEGSGALMSFDKLQVINCTASHMQRALQHLGQVMDRQPGHDRLALIIPPDAAGHGRHISITPEGVCSARFATVNGRMEITHLTVAGAGPSQEWTPGGGWQPSAQPLSRDALCADFANDLQDAISLKAAAHARSMAGASPGARDLEFDRSSHFAQVSGARIVIRRKSDGVVDNPLDYALASLKEDGRTQLTQVIDGQRVMGQVIAKDAPWPGAPAQAAPQMPPVGAPAMP